jgi:hypothetical protein
VICIVGNKQDLIDNEKVGWETAKLYADVFLWYILLSEFISFV